VRAAIEAQRALHQLNRRRAAENERREKKNAARVSSGDPALPLLRLLELGSGINTGTATVGLMGSQDSLSYTVLGQEVNLASRLEGVSGRGRIIISDATYREIQRLDPDLAATCTELPPQDVKGFRETVKIYEVRWRDGDAEIRPEGGGGSTEARPSADATVKR
jgi:class 3 adenylate cyclase